MTRPWGDGTDPGSAGGLSKVKLIPGERHCQHERIRELLERYRVHIPTRRRARVLKFKRLPGGFDRSDSRAGAPPASLSRPPCGRASRQRHHSGSDFQSALYRDDAADVM
ncbi:hypothetical protein [Rhodococcoides yunnanense]|uniref:Transposase n=1 Tax=Rhodococcoides yunnanense TaxID=278209 RepID=A0ABU4BK63_9NOCA|nr:hypothetical protein [Rhodococcus yunnanensis]MDV6264607.1 hypothetical protein [Rhodococcus yunnanensis]